MNYLSLSVISASAAGMLGMLALAQPANAVIFDWQFTNENGNFGSNTDVVSGFIEFSAASFGDLANQTNVPAIDLQITSVTGLPTGSDPFFGDGGIELDTNLVPGIGNNTFSFDADGEIIAPISFETAFNDNNGIREQLNLRPTNNVTSDLNNDGLVGPVSFMGDSNSSSIQYTQRSTSVPFEFSPTLGFLAVSSFFAGSHLLKRRNTFVKSLFLKKY